jgi:hypothetical protein
MLDLFCGRLGWSKAFLARGWECVGVDLVEPPEIPQGFQFFACDVLEIRIGEGGYAFRPNPVAPDYLTPLGQFDFICASSPCEQFSVHGMKHFHPNPPYPELGIKLFNHTREICEESGVPYVMENVRAAQQFVGKAAHHCGSFYLWGNGVPPLMHQGIVKVGGDKDGPTVARMSPEQRAEHRKEFPRIFPEHQKRLRERYGMTGTRQAWSGSKARAELTAQVATIPPELANCVADYAERLIEQKVAQ